MTKQETIEHFLTEEDKEDDISESFIEKDSQISKIIKIQLDNKEHPIRKIINKFWVMFVKNYKEFVDKSEKSTKELYLRLEQANNCFFERTEDSERVKNLYLKKRESEKIGDIIESDKTKIPKYFIFNEVISDIKVFIRQIYAALFDFYEVMVPREKLQWIQEDIMESIINLTLRGKMHKVVFSFFKLEYEERRELLIDKFKEFIEVKPEHVGIDEKFALNSTSPIVEIFDKMCWSSMRINTSMCSENTHDN